MATHPDPRLDAAHVAYFGATGAGKSQALKANPAIPIKGARVIAWDPSQDHARGRGGARMHYADTPAAFQRLLAGAIRSGSGFRVGYCGPRSIPLWEDWFCPLIWRVLDGRTRTFLIAEEVARVSPHAGEATPQWGLLLEEGRKYGLAIHCTSQRPQGVSKAVFDNVTEWWIGRQQGRARQMFVFEGIDAAALDALRPLTFLRYRAGADLETRTIPYIG